MTAPLNQLGWWQRPTALPDDPPLWRDPVRLLFIASAICLVVGSLMPWAIGIDPGGRSDSFRATQGTGEGVMLIAVGLALIFLARDRTMWDTTSRAVQLSPLLLALVSIAMWIGADHYARVMIDYWSRGGGSGFLTEARNLTAGGITAIVVGLAWLEWRRPARIKAGTRPLLVELGVTRWTAASVIVAGSLGLLGAIVAVLVGVLVMGTAGIIIAVLLAVFGLFIGIGVGLAIVGWFEARLKRREESSPTPIPRG